MAALPPRLNNPPPLDMATVHGSFTKVPVEIFLRFIRYLDTPSICAMRLTCRSIEKALFQPFVSEYFSKRQFMLTLFSLNALVDIASEPRLSGYLRHVIIGLDVILPDHNRSYCDITNLARDQSLLLRIGGVGRLLTDAFARLPNLEVVEMRDYASGSRWRDGTTWSSYGSRTLEQFHGKGKLSFAPSTNCTEILLIILCALGRAGARPTTLDLNLRQADKGIHPDFLLHTPALGDLPQPVVASMKNVFLKISLQSHDHWLGLCDLVSRLKSARHLRLNFSSFGHDCSPFLMWLAEVTDDKPHTNFPRPPLPILAADLPLQRLDFGGISCAPAPLLGVVRKFASSLTGLSLRRIHLIDRGSKYGIWRRFLRGLYHTNGLNLRLLEIWEPAISSGDRTFLSYVDIQGRHIYEQYQGPDCNAFIANLCRTMSRKGRAEADAQLAAAAGCPPVPHYVDDESDDQSEDDDDSNEDDSWT